MAVIVVSGDGRNVGKTSVVCALIAAVPEFRWTAVKISTHAHQLRDPVWRETAPGQGSDTARYLAAGAERAYLVAAAEEEVAGRLELLRADAAGAADWIFESNRVLAALRPDLCLAVLGAEGSALKPSFARIADRAHATVRRGEQNRVLDGPGVGFEIADMGQLSPPMRQWVRLRLGCG